MVGVQILTLRINSNNVLCVNSYVIFIYVRLTNVQIIYLVYNFCYTQWSEEVLLVIHLKSADERKFKLRISDVRF